MLHVNAEQFMPTLVRARSGNERMIYPLYGISVVVVQVRLKTVGDEVMFPENRYPLKYAIVAG